MHGRDSRRNQGGNYNNHGYHNGNNNNRTGQARNHVIPNEGPFTAYIGNAPDTMVQGDFEHQLFRGLKVKQVRLIRDRQTDRFRGFAYVDFEDADSLRSAIALDGTNVNDRPIRIDVASRSLDAAKSEGFRNKPGFESRNGPRQPSGNSNNQSSSGYRHGGRAVHQHGPSRMIDGGYYENGYNDDYSNQDSHNNNKRQSEQEKEQTSPSRRISDGDVFIAPDTPTSNEDENHEYTNNKEDTTAVTRQKSRNWADCPIDESVVDTTPPSSMNNTLTGDDTDDFQIVRNKNTKSRLNQQSSSRSTRGHSGGNNSRGFPSQISAGRTHYDQMSPAYLNQTPQYYHHHQQAPLQAPPLDMGLSYHNNRHQPSSGSQQRVNSNRNYSDEQSNGNEKHSISATSGSSRDINSNSQSSENRPRLQLLPRSQKLSSSSDDKQSIEPAARNSNIFGSGKPRDEHDPKLTELDKHIEEVVEKEQHLLRTLSNESTSSITKPVRILSAGSKSSVDH